MFETNYTPYSQPAWRQPIQLPMQQPMQRPQQYYNPTPAPSNVQWVRVNGAQGVRDVSVPPGGEVWIMDESRPVFYLKQANAMGQAITKAYRFEEINIDDSGTGPDLSVFATKEDLAAIHRRLERLDKFASELGGVTDE